MTQKMHILLFKLLSVHHFKSLLFTLCEFHEQLIL